MAGVRYGFDMLSVDIEDGKVVDARVASGGYFIEMGEADIWALCRCLFRHDNRICAPGPPVPDPATILTFATGDGPDWREANIRRLAG